MRMICPYKRLPKHKRKEDQVFCFCESRECEHRPPHEKVLPGHEYSAPCVVHYSRCPDCVSTKSKKGREALAVYLEEIMTGAVTGGIERSKKQ